MRAGVYEELARGFGAERYQPLIASSEANATRVKTATEFQSRHLRAKGDEAGGSNDGSFASSLLRRALFAVRTARREQDAHAGRAWLRSELGPVYWHDRERLIEILRYLGRMGSASEEWAADAEAARLVAGAVENDHS
jgi:hypothetical protein